jgi:hypothetical protein
MLQLLTNKATFKDYLLILIICFFGFWQLSLFQNIMKWDILDINLPWRYFVSECLQNNTLPLWNPFINCGFPQHADPMTWYPISWLIGYLFGNDLLTLQYEFLFHIFIGGIGAYKIGELYKLNRQTKLILSISFMFSGLFISNAQHFGWIISAAWFPLIIYQYVLFCRNLNLKNGAIFILFLFFLLSGGYPGFFITTVYILFALFVYYLVSYIKEKWCVKFILFNLIIAVVFVLLSAVVLISSFELAPHLTRYNQLSIDYVIQGYLPLKALMSFILPYATATNPEYWGTDSSLINSYFGIITLIFLVYSLITIKSKKVRIIFFIGVFFLLTAMAGIFPFRKWIYYLPFMDVFRFPVIFRFFAYFSFIVVAGFGIHSFIKEVRNEKLLRSIIMVFIGILLVFFIFNAFYIEKWKFKSLLFLDFKTFLDSATVNDRIFLQAFISIGLLVVFLFAIKKIKVRRFLLIGLIAIDMIIATQLNIYHTIVSFDSPKPTQLAINNLPKGFLLPSINEKIMDIKGANTIPIPFLWRNLDIFHKKTSFTGYTPYHFLSKEKCETKGLFHSVIKNPLFYLADDINSNLIIDSLSIDTLSSKKIQITNFNPNRVELIVKNNSTQLLTFVQNYYKGWKVYINKKEGKLIQSNYTFMSVWLPKGENQIVLEYKPKNILNAFYMSAIVLIGLLLFITISNLKRLSTSYKKE